MNLESRSLLFSAAAILICTLTSCAKPNYVEKSPGNNGGQEKTSSGCDAVFASGAGCVSWKWETVSAPGQPGVALLKVGRLNKADGSFLPEDPANREVFVELFMPDMGHGSAPVRLERLDNGTYRATKIRFSMEGAWEIRVQLKAGDDVQDQAVLPYTY